MAKQAPSAAPTQPPGKRPRVWPYVLLGMGGVAFLLLLNALARPQWLLSETVWDTARGLLASRGITVSGDVVRAHLDWEPFPRLVLRLKVREPCFERDTGIEFCARSAELHTAVRLGWGGIQWEWVGPVRLGESRLVLPPADPSAPKPPPEPLTLPSVPIPGRLPQLVGGIEIAPLEVSWAGEDRSARMEARCPPTDAPDWRCTGEVAATFPPRRVETTWELGIQPRSLELRAKARLNEPRIPVELTVASRPDTGWTARVEASGNEPPLDGSVLVTGRADPGDQEVGGTVRLDWRPPGQARGPDWDLRLAVTTCDYRAGIGSVQVTNCGMRLRGGGKFGRLVHGLGGTLSAVIRTEAQSATVDLAIPRYRGKLVHLDGRIGGTASWGDTHRAPFIPDEDTRLNLEVADFQSLVDLLGGTPFAVPAPLNALQGTLNALVRPGTVERSLIEFPFQLGTNLASRQQSLRMTGHGSFRWPMTETGTPELRVSIANQNTVLAAPDLSLAKFPALAPDPRIGAREYPQAKEVGPGGEKPAMKWHVNFRARQHPIRIRTNLVGEPVPVAVRMIVDSDGTRDGWVELRPFTLELFRRQARIQRLRATLLPASADAVAELDGIITFPFPDHTVRMRIGGTASRTRITLESDPPLPESQIYSLLIFGQTMDDLDEGQTESLSGLRNAAARRTLGLASLYFLASTPIQRVDYDPQTGTVNVQVRIGDKTSLLVAGGRDRVESVGFRRNLGGNWAITTEVAPPGARDRQNLISSFLEWFVRY